MASVPEPWPPTPTTDAAVERHLRDALDELPATWRAVVSRHDAAGRSDADVARELGITREQQRDILARARAALRDHLDDRLRRSGDR